MRRSVLRPGFFVSTANPEDVLEAWALVDVARLRAAKLSAKRDMRLFVWEWNPVNGLRRVRASAERGKVYWHAPCRRCAVDGAGCDHCEYLGSVIDPAAPVESQSDAV